MNTNIRLIFLKVENTEAKLTRIAATVKQHFDMRDRILITVADEASASFVDQMLWKIPEDSFLPHIIASRPVKEAITIVIGHRNLNEANVLINLCPACSPLLQQMQISYELLDLTTPAKSALSQQRLDTYQQAGYVPTIT